MKNTEELKKSIDQLKAENLELRQGLCLIKEHLENLEYETFNHLLALVRKLKKQNLF